MLEDARRNQNQQALAAARRLRPRGNSGGRPWSPAVAWWPAWRLSRCARPMPAPSRRANSRSRA